ncbi:MAG: ATP-binding cassette domain-containing protein [Magnetococcales bacterium]|nr:ATP-binding cassette domain-containing protein [Magnetococcales bacterium]
MNAKLKLSPSVQAHPDQDVIRRLYAYTRPYLRYWSVAIVCMILVSGLTALQAYLIKPALDKIFIEKDYFYFTYLPWVIAAVFLLKGICYYFYEYYLERVGQSIVRDIRMKIFEHLHRQSLSFHYQYSTGELISRILNDVSLIQASISSASVGLVKNVFQIIGLVGLIYYLDWQLAIFCSGFIVVAFMPVIFFSRIHRRLNNRLQEIMAHMTAVLHESLLGSLIIQAFCMERFEIERFSRVLKDNFQVTIQDTKTRKLSHAVMEQIGGIGIIAIIVYGGSRVIAGESSTGTFFSFLTALVMTYEPIKGITKINSMIQQGLAAATRVFWLLDCEPEIQNRPDATPLPPFAGEIRFENVWFRYLQSEADVLQGVDFTLKKGQKIAIVGPSGSGKTTLANLLPRFVEGTQGSIRFDGHDIREVTLESLRSQIAVVTQNTVLFNDTISNNIAYGLPDCPRERIRHAARQANALEFIEALPQGFDTQIGESGIRLSGGQRQRLAVARAFMKDAPILILDEATSALDTVSERAVQDAIDQLMSGRTVIIIAHRLITVERADHILLLKHGRIVESGTHAELLTRKDGEYRKLIGKELVEEGVPLLADPSQN